MHVSEDIVQIFLGTKQCSLTSFSESLTIRIQFKGRLNEEQK